MTPVREERSFVRRREDQELRERDIDVEGRLRTIESWMADFKLEWRQARPQLIIMSALGSAAGGVCVAVVIWFITRGR